MNKPKHFFLMQFKCLCMYTFGSEMHCSIITQEPMQFSMLSFALVTMPELGTKCSAVKLNS